MSEELLPLAISVIAGLSIAFFVLALRVPLAERYHNDVMWLDHTIWRFTPNPFDGRPWVAGYYAISALVFVVLFAIFPSKVVALVLWLALLVIPKMVIQRKWEARRKAIEERLPESVMKMSSSVASGMSLIQAIERLAEREPAPINTEFRIIASYWNLGSDFTSTIEEAKRRLDLQNFSLFASALLINQKMGGNITLTLERLAKSLVTIDRMKRDIHVATSEGRTNIKVLAIAPLIMLFFIYFIDAEATVMLFTTPLGNIMLGTCALLTLIGFFWAWKIVNADV